GPLVGRGGFADAVGAGGTSRSAAAGGADDGCSLAGGALCAATELTAGCCDGAAGLGTGSAVLVLKRKRSAPATTPTTMASARRKRPARDIVVVVTASTALRRPSIPTAGADSMVVRRIEAAEAPTRTGARRD